MKPLRIFLGCEASGCVRREWACAGHHVVSCDLRSAQDDAPPYPDCALYPYDVCKTGWHHRGDVFRFLNRFPAGWFDLAILHPPCTYLAHSGVQWLYEDGRRGSPINQQRWRRMLAGASFLRRLHTHRAYRKSATENPKMHGFAQKAIGIPRWAQHFQPWQFGHEEVKEIFLWLNEVPPLRLLARLDVGPPPAGGTSEYRRWAVVHHAGPSDTRGIERSAFYSGIAGQMVKQWQKFLQKEKLAT